MLFRSVSQSRYVWLVKPFNCQQPHIEFAEQMIIKAMSPEHNKDKNPYKSSINYGRYTDVLELYGKQLELFND